jgi:hypothetical protein
VDDILIDNAGYAPADLVGFSTDPFFAQFSIGRAEFTGQVHGSPFPGVFGAGGDPAYSLNGYHQDNDDSLDELVADGQDYLAGTAQNGEQSITLQAGYHVIQPVLRGTLTKISFQLSNPLTAQQLSLILFGSGGGGLTFSANDFNRLLNGERVDFDILGYGQASGLNGYDSSGLPAFDKYLAYQASSDPNNPLPPGTELIISYEYWEVP